MPSSTITIRLTRQELARLDSVPGATRSEKIRVLLAQKSSNEETIRQLDTKLAAFAKNLSAVAPPPVPPSSRNDEGGQVSEQEFRSVMAKVVTQFAILFSVLEQQDIQREARQKATQTNALSVAIAEGKFGRNTQ